MNKELTDRLEIQMINVSSNLSIIKTLIDILKNEFEESHNAYDNKIFNLIILSQRLINNTKNQFRTCSKLSFKLTQTKQ